MKPKPNWRGPWRLRNGRWERDYEPRFIPPYMMTGVSGAGVNQVVSSGLGGGGGAYGYVSNSAAFNTTIRLIWRGPEVK